MSGTDTRLVFTLEALQAGKGDCLILHFGPASQPKFIVIDGGPRTIFETSLQPRLDQLKRRWAPKTRLPLEMLVVSHIDDDHIRGVLDLTALLVDRALNGEFLPYTVKTVWHNSFDDILGKSSADVFRGVSPTIKAAAEGGVVPAGLEISQPAAMVLASVPQGRQLRTDIERLKWRVNAGFEGLIMASGTTRTTIHRKDELDLTVLSPRKERLLALHQEWEEAMEEARAKKLERASETVAAAYVDRSVFNLSSMVILAEYQGRKVLLTGDARGDDIAAGLQSAGLLVKNGQLHVDVFKLPHHGSSRNVRLDLFQQITADHYLFSANGENGNPDVDTLEMIAKARGADPYSLHFTNRDGKGDLAATLNDFFRRVAAPQRTVRYRAERDLSIRIDLLEPATY